jgi:Chalcone isomerase-like
MRYVSLFALLPVLMAPITAWSATVVVDGVPISETAYVGDQKLVLNGAGTHQRSVGKAYVLALYAPQKKASLEELKKYPGAKRIQLQPLKELTGTTFSKYFLQDFPTVSTKAEFTKLIDEVASVGAIYSTLPKVTPSDVVSIEWHPGKGVLFSKNGRPISAGMFDPYLNTPNSELLFHIWLRIYAGGTLPQELQNNLFGQSVSMQTVASVKPQ